MKTACVGGCKGLVAAAMTALLAAVPAYAQSVVSPVFVHKDGQVSDAAHDGTGGTIAVEADASAVTAWLTFQTGAADLSHVGTSGTALLVVYVSEVSSAGTLVASALDGPVSGPEAGVQLADLSIGSVQDSIAVAADAAGAMLHLDITKAIAAQGAGFNGVALTGSQGLRARLSAKEGVLRPVVLITHDLDRAAGRWYAGTETPAGSIGDIGDYYLCTTDGTVYAKDGAGWTLSTSILGPAGRDDGRVLRWRGGWQSSVSYSPYDVVTYRGATYFTQSATQMLAPGSALSPWTVLAAAGGPGTTAWTDGGAAVTTARRVGLGDSSPAESLSVSGNARITGDLIAGDSMQADSVYLTELRSLPGSGFEEQAPDSALNAAILEVAGIAVPDPVVVIRGPGVEIDRFHHSWGFTIDASGPDMQRLWREGADISGLSMEPPFIIETAGVNANNLRAYFDEYAAGLDTVAHDLSLVVNDSTGAEIVRWNLVDFAPKRYEPGSAGRTRFTFEQRHWPDAQWQCVLATSNYTGYPRPHFDSATVTGVEIDGVISFTPTVEVDTVAQTLTMTYPAGEGCPELTAWTRMTLERGVPNGVAARGVSVIELDPTGAYCLGDPWFGFCTVARMNYHHCFPLRFEVLKGFGLHTTLVERITIAYGFREEP